MMRRRNLLAVLALTMVVPAVGCCKSGSDSGLKLTYDGATDKAMEATSGFIFATTKTFSWPDGSGGFAKAKASSHSIYLGNFELDASRGMISLSSSLKEDGQMRVSFGLVGADGTEAGGKDSPPLAKGDYTAEADKFNKVDWVEIAVFEGGKETKHRFDKPTGTVKVTSSAADSISGEIDIKDGKNAVKGGFTAKPSR
jgi:hypothetical protein